MSADNFANSLDPEQARQNVGPDLFQAVKHSDGIPERIFWKRWFEKHQQATKKKA